MAITNFSALWENHPGPHAYPCDEDAFPNQCAIRMGIALEASGYNTSSFDVLYRNRRCWFHRDAPHILAANNIAVWMRANKHIFGDNKIYQSTNIAERYEIKGQKDIVYINNGWGSTDHIDLWDGEKFAANDGNNRLCSRDYEKRSEH